MLERLPDPEAAARWCETVRNSGKTLGFVPTMGALHEGHLALVERAVAECGACCVSIYVNPLQFDEASDFRNYPRDFEDDCRMLESRGCAMAFSGSLEGFFAGKLDEDGKLRSDELLDPGPRAVGLEGEYREGHFAGVATIVRRLFEVARPTRAYFGQKDFQQTLVVEDVARALGYPQVEVCPTVREASGLAMSSRNQRLKDHEREEALVLSRALKSARAAWCSGERDAAELAAVLRSVFEEAQRPFEYAAVRDPERWTAEDPAGPMECAVALVAARVGAVRLIDNMVLSKGEDALTEWVTARAPAKVNWTLRVLGKRDDGFHELSTLMSCLELADTVRVRPREDRDITLELKGPAASSDIPNDERNLVWKAASRMLEFTGSERGLDLQLEKRIPSRAGLGGGSSDAAACLFAAGKALQVPEANRQSELLLRELGSDCVFFGSASVTGSAVCEGRGELVDALRLFEPGLDGLFDHSRGRLRDARGVPSLGIPLECTQGGP